MHSEASSAQRGMGFFSVLALVIGVQLGSGIFLLPGQLSPYGVWSLLSWVITGTGALLLTTIFSQLSILYPHAGGPHVYVHHAFGKKAAFYVGWCYWVISWLSSVPVLVLLVSSLENLWGDMGTWGRFLLEVGILSGLCLLNMRGAVLSGASEIVFSAMKVIPMILIPVICIPFWKSVHVIKTVSTHTPLESLHQASLLTFWGFIGLEAGTTMVNCVHKPHITLPRALFWGTLVVMGIYLINTTTVMGVIPQNILEHHINPYALLLTNVGGEWWGKAITVLVVIMCFGTLNSWTLSAGQVAMVAAQENLFPAFFGHKNQYGCAARGITVSTIMLMVFMLLLHNKSLSEQVNQLIQISTSLFVWIYLMGILSYCRLQLLTLPRKVLAIVSIAFCLWFLGSTPWSVWIGCAIIPAVGWILARTLAWPAYAQ